MKIITQDELNKIPGIKKENPVSKELIKLEVGQVLEVDFDDTEKDINSCILAAKLKTGYSFSTKTSRELRKWFVTRIS